MMRASWTGAINFGLVSIPVRLFRAVTEHRARFRYLHRVCRTPLEVRRYCPLHEEEVPWEEVVRGYEIEPDQFVVVEPEDLEQAATDISRSHRIDVQAFVDLGEVDPLYYGTSYYAEPLPEGRPAYALLQQAMHQTARAAVARMALRDRETLAAVRPYDSMLVVQTLFFADEVRPPTTLDVPTEAVPPRELRTAIRLIENMAEPFAAQHYVDQYHRRLMTRIEERAQEEVPVGVAAGPAREEAELLGELQTSIDAVQEARREAR